nr:SDR family oxidoreductase [Nitrospirota bacterium]
MRSLKQLMDLSGRRALVTGGAGHIGLAVEEALVELGAMVAVLDLDESGCEKRVEALSRIRAGSAVAVPCDLHDESAARRSVQEVVKKLNGLDIIVHCAAYVGTTDVPGWSVPFEQQTVAAWDQAIRVSLTSAFVIVQEARKALEASGRGSVILFASTYGLVGPDMSLYDDTKMSNPAGYGVSKGGLLQLMRYLATVLAPRVRVNAISPGGVRRNQPEAFHQRYISRTPMVRMATEEDFKGAVAYLASDLSGYVTGHNLVVDGGWTAW